MRFNPHSLYQLERVVWVDFLRKFADMGVRWRFATALAAESNDAPAVPIGIPKASPMTETLDPLVTEPGPLMARLNLHLWALHPNEGIPKLLVTSATISSFEYSRNFSLMMESSLTIIPSLSPYLETTKPSGIAPSKSFDGPHATKHYSLFPLRLRSNPEHSDIACSTGVATINQSYDSTIL